MKKNLLNFILINFLAFTLSFLVTSKEETNFNENLLVVSLMVKDEESVMVDTLKPLIDSGIKSFFIYDTGSTDKTIEVTKEYFKKRNIENFYITQEPWKDYSTSRNRALDLTEEKFPNAIFMLMPDAEWYIKNGEKLLEFCKQNRNNSCPNHLIQLTSPTINFYTARLIKCKSKVRFEGAVHEIPNFCTNSKVPDVSFELRISQKGAEKTAKRFHRDLRLLLNSFIQDPTDARTVFYLAQTYQCLGDLVNAMKYYNFRIMLNRYDEDHYICHYRIAQIMDEQLEKENKGSWEEVMAKYLESYAMRPHRIEPLIYIADHYLRKNKMALSYLFSAPTLHVPYPESDLLFVDQYIYNYTRYEMLGRCAWYVGQFEIGEQATRKALEVKPEAIHLHTNLSFYLSKKEVRANAILQSNKVATKKAPEINSNQPEIVCIITSFNNEKYLFRNLDSLVHQKTEKGEPHPVKYIYVNDASTDKTGPLVEKYVRDNGLQNIVQVIHNSERVGALENLYKVIHTLPDHVIVATMDGDDFASNDKVFARIEKEYKNKNTWMTYGQYMYYPEGYIGVCKEIAPEVKNNNTFRRSEWVTSQLRTFYAGLFKRIKKEELMHEGKFFPMAWDLAFMYRLLEMSSKNHIVFIPDVLYIYNHHNPISDHNVSRKYQADLTTIICNQTPSKPLDQLPFDVPWFKY